MGCARLGQPDQRIVAGTLGDLVTVEFGPPLHCMVICGELHPCEKELLAFFQAKAEEIGAYVKPAEEGSDGSSSGEDSGGEKEEGVQ